MIKLYIPQCDGKTIIDPLRSVLGYTETQANIFGEPDIWKDYVLPAEVVTNPAWSDYICVPHTWAAILHEHDYIAHIAQVAREHSKRVIIFVIGDTNEHVFFPAGVSVIVIRSSQYRDRLLPYEVIMPAYAHDLRKISTLYAGMEQQHATQEAAKAIVSFCGWAQASGIKTKISSLVKDVLWSTLGLFIKHLAARRPGIVLRKIGIDVLKKSSEVIAKIIMRPTYTGSIKTLQGEPRALRAEYIANMDSCTYAFAPKGDGNFSVRFFEALSLGKIPVVLDTQIVFPFENVIQYDDFVIKVSLENIDRIDTEIAEWHRIKGVSGVRDAQIKARAAFDQYLNIRVFCTYVFTREFLEQIPRTV